MKRVLLALLVGVVTLTGCATAPLPEPDEAGFLAYMHEHSETGVELYADDELVEDGLEFCERAREYKTDLDDAFSGIYDAAPAQDAPLEILIYFSELETATGEFLCPDVA